MCLERRPRRRRSFDHHGPGHLEGAGRRDHGCAGRDHVVDEKDATRRTSDRRERRSGKALPLGPARLGWSGLPRQEWATGTVQTAGDGARQQAGLVEAAFAWIYNLFSLSGST